VTPQQQLVERVRDDLLTDGRVRGLWLTGSLGTGTDDTFSDVDMFVLVRDDDLPGYLDGWPDLASREMTQEFLRVLGLLPVVLGRDELVTAATGAGLLRQMLTTLLRYRAEGDRLSGALHLSRVLPPVELAALAALPPVYAERGSVVRLHLACAAMFLPVARELLGEAYPFALEAACWAHLRAHLPVEGG